MKKIEQLITALEGLHKGVEEIIKSLQKTKSEFTATPTPVEEVVEFYSPSFTPTPTQKTEEWKEQFNKRFRNTDWYPNEWYSVESFIQTLLTKREEAVRVKIVETVNKVLYIWEAASKDGRVQVQEVRKLIDRLQGGK